MNLFRISDLGFRIWRHFTGSDAIPPNGRHQS